jgi:hypothetical protein
MRLDEDRLEVLRKWGAGLSTDSREELRAAGKAIMLLVEEIDRLQVDVWHARAAVAAGGSPSDDAEQAERPEQEPADEAELSTTLRDRLGAVLPSLSAKKST